MSIQITLDANALDRLIGDNEEVRMRLAQTAVQELYRRRVKPITDTRMGEVLKLADRWYRTSNGNWPVATAIGVITVEHRIRDLDKEGGCKCKSTTR